MFSKTFHVIFSNELQIKCEDNGLHATFLNLDATVVDDTDMLFMITGNSLLFIVCIPVLNGTFLYIIFMGQYCICTSQNS